MRSATPVSEELAFAAFGFVTSDGSGRGAVVRSPVEGTRRTMGTAAASSVRQRGRCPEGIEYPLLLCSIGVLVPYEWTRVRVRFWYNSSEARMTPWTKLAT